MMRWFSKKPEVAEIYKVAIRHQKELLAEEGVAVKELLRLWRGAYLEIADRRRSVMRRVQWAKNNGVDASPSWLFMEERWMEYQATLRALIGNYATKAEKITEKRQNASIAMARDHAFDIAKTAGIDTGFIRVPNEAFVRLVGFLRDGSPLRDIFNSFGGLTVQASMDVMTTGLLLGDNPRVIGSRLAKVADIPKRRAVTIARNESLRAYRTALGENYKANSDVISGMRRVSALDRRTCILCVLRHGHVYELGEEMDVHIACRCTFVPVVIHRPVTRQTGAEWFQSQPVDYQKKALGPSRYQMWQSGKVKLEDFVQVEQNPVWGPTTKLVSLSGLAAK